MTAGFCPFQAISALAHAAALDAFLGDKFSHLCLQVRWRLSVNLLFFDLVPAS